MFLFKERLIILHMLEQKKISLEEAEHSSLQKDSKQETILMTAKQPKKERARAAKGRD